MNDLSRRDFLKLATTGLVTASGLLGLGALLRFLGNPPEQPAQTELDLGPASSYKVGSRTVVADGSALLIHTKDGFSALSLICTHLGCTVEPKDNGFACPCHGSLYMKDGTVVRGPAQKPLRKLKVEEAASGNIILHLD